MKAILLGIALAGPLTGQGIGPKPTMEEFAALVEPAVAFRLINPKSATFNWPYQLLTGPAGYYTCGLVRGQNNDGRYSEVWVSAVVANGQVISSQSSEGNGMLAYACEKRIKKGELVSGQ